MNTLKNSMALKIGRLGCCALLVGLLVFPVAALAEDAENRVYKLDNIVVSTTRNETPVGDAAQSVTVLSEEDIMASPFERVEDIIRTVPGVYNTRHYGTQTSGVSNPLRTCK